MKKAIRFLYQLYIIIKLVRKNSVDLPVEVPLDLPVDLDLPCMFASSAGVRPPTGVPRSPIPAMMYRARTGILLFDCIYIISCAEACIAEAEAPTKEERCPPEPPYVCLCQGVAYSTSSHGIQLRS